MDFLDGGGPADEGMVGFDDERWLENHQQHYLDGLRAYGRLQDACLLRYGGVSIGLEVRYLELPWSGVHPQAKLIHGPPLTVFMVVHVSDMPRPLGEPPAPE